MKKLLNSMWQSKFFVACLMLMTLSLTLSLSAKAQNIKLEGRTFIVEQSDSSSSKGKYTKTEYKYQDKTGVYPIYLSSNGNAFIFKVSKAGKEWRRYLPEVTKQLGTKKDEQDATRRSKRD